MAVSISIHGENRSQKNNERLEVLKARQFHDQVPQKVEYMVPALYELTKEGNVDKFLDELQKISEEKVLSLDAIFNQVSPSGKSLLHVAAKYERKEITELVARQFPFLIIKQNLHGDTPLHVAARAGKLETTETLVNCAKDFPDVGSVLRIMNEKGNTALHEAVMICNQKEVHFLVMADQDVAYLANKEGKSPLYLAAKTDHDVNILSTLLQAIESDDNSLRKLEGKSPMHAAVERKEIDMLKEIVSRKPELMDYKDEKERTPLHCAASIGYVKGIQYLLNEFSHAGLEKDKDGFYPIHLGCENGHVNVVEELLKKWPDPTELLNNKGQNILHVAAENGKENVVKLLISTPRLRLDVDDLVNEQDHDGNTPLHLATIRGQSFTVWKLGRGKKEDYLKLKNNEGLTAYDIAEKQSQGKYSEDSKHPVCLCGKLAQGEKIVDEENLKAIVVTAEKKSTIDTKNSKDPDLYDTMMTLSILHLLHLAFGEHGNPNNKSKFRRKDEHKDTINTLMVVAGLVSSVTFTAAMQPPAGTTSNDYGEPSGPSASVLFQLFIMFDTIALNFSVAAAICLTWTHIGDKNLRFLGVWFASTFLSFSLCLMAISFWCAVSIVDDYIFFAFVLGIGLVFLIPNLVLTIVPLTKPSRLKHLWMPIFYFQICCLDKFNCFMKRKKQSRQ